MNTYLSGNAPRCMECFDFDWHFYHGKQEQEPGVQSTEEYQSVQLPHDWSLYYPFDENAPSSGSGGYAETGIGWYRKLFRVSGDVAADEKVFIRFDGVYMLARVWLNGRELGNHVYGYTPFEWEITDFLKQKEDNVIDVRVDNSAQPNSRWYSGSGITRDVWIYRVKKDHVLPYGVWVLASSVTQNQARLKVETQISVSAESFADGAGIRVETALFSPAGVLCTVKRTKAETDGETAVCQDFQIDSPLRWDLETPFLYEVVTRLYRGDVLLDEVHTRTGLRSAVFDKNKGFLLNGKSCKLKGVCVHHDGGCVGAAVPVQIWERRLHKLKEMGANAVRMSHNPPDPALLDLCDREGFLVMDEAFDEWKFLKSKKLGSNTHESRGYSDWFVQCHEEDLKAMIVRDRNHPSVIIWSIGNEVPDQTDPEGYLTARHLKEFCRKLDPKRQITQANDQISAEPYAAEESFLNELDVVGYNYVGRWRERAETFYDEDKRAHPDWCMAGTENSSTGGIRGEYLWEIEEKSGWWRRPYYSAPVEVGKLLRFTMSRDYVAGDFMWTGIDYLGEAHWPERSSSAGVMDTCGFEKDGFYFYQSIWKREKPMVHLFPHWNLEVEKGTILPVLCYTSCDCAELFLNGKSYGKKAYSYPAYGMTEQYGHFEKAPSPVSTGDLFLSWDVPYEPGCIEVVGFCNGQEAARHIVKTAGEPAELKAVCYQSQLPADGRAAGQIEVFIVDAEGNLCPQADQRITFTVEGAAVLVGVDNGNPRSHESMKENHIAAFHGQAFGVVRSDGRAGECRVCVAADHLKESTVTLKFG